jgi:HTH-type transcriptional regulator/antitoxin HipB
VDYPIKTLSQLRPILKGFRKAAGLTQAMMASHLGVTQQTYAQLEANPAAVSVERLFRVLRVLNVDLMLTQTAHALPKAGGIESIVPPTPRGVPAAERVAGIPAAKSGSTARTRGGKRETQDAHNKGAAAMVLSDKGAAKRGEGTFVVKRRADAASDSPRSDRMSGAVSKKRESW